MTEAEIIEKINSKTQELEEKRTQNADPETIEALEKELSNLVSSLNNNENIRQNQVFLDECAD
jgi:hypothetical protein